VPEQNIFDQAVLSLFGETQPSAEEPKAPEPERVTPAPRQSAETIRSPRPLAAPSQPRPVRPASSAPRRLGLEDTYLASGVSLRGEMHVKGDIEIAGDLRGTLVVDGGAVLRSKLACNVAAERLELIGCRLTGDARVSGLLVMDRASVVGGRIYAGELRCDGRVHGDIQVSGNAEFLSGAIIDGTITTGTMTVERGAVIGGAVTMGAASVTADAPEPPKQAAVGRPAEKPSAPHIRKPLFPSVSAEQIPEPETAVKSAAVQPAAKAAARNAAAPKPAAKAAPAKSPVKPAASKAPVRAKTKVRDKADLDDEQDDIVIHTVR
jgi:cytoskeletal protein CcmA (bactofilin family)